MDDLPSRVVGAIRQDLTGVLRRHRIGSVLTSVLPPTAMMRTRAAVLRCAGWNVGRGSAFAETPRLIGSGRLLQSLEVGEEVFVNIGAVWELSDSISIGHRVAIGHDVMLLTSSHRIGSPARRADELFTGAITVGDGTWIGARSTVLPGVHIGAGALVAANTVVREDVPADALYAGNPGRVVRSLGDGNRPDT